jgi:hypothetical protein
MHHGTSRAALRSRGLSPPKPSEKLEAAVEAEIAKEPLDRLDALRNALAVYRLAFGQARQEDVIDHLLKRLGPDRARALAAELRIDLRPPQAKPTA